MNDVHGTSRLVLVRHAMPVIDLEVPADQWHLGPEGCEAARTLGPLVDGPAYYVASDEPKTAETLRELAGSEQVLIDPGFSEIRRPHVDSPAYDYHAVARTYLEGTLPEGWEAHAEAVGRFGDAVLKHGSVAAADGRTLVIGTHGVILALWLAGRVDLRPGTVPFWETLTLPDVIDVDLTAGTATRRAR